MTAPENARDHRETVIRAQLKKRLQLAGKPLMPAWDDAMVAAIMAAADLYSDSLYTPPDPVSPALAPAPSSPPRPARRTTTRKPASRKETASS